MALDTPPKITSKRILGGKLETTTGTAITLAATDGVDYVTDPKITYNTEVIQIPPQAGFLGGKGTRTGKRSATASWSTEIRGDGAAPPDWFKYMRACGMTLSTATLTPLSAPADTVTIGCNVDGRFRRLIGGMGTWEMNLVAGMPGTIKFDFQGAQEALQDEAIWVPTFNTIIPPNVSAAAITIFSATYVIPALTITANNNIILRNDVAARDEDGVVTGIRAAFITGRRYQVRISPEALPLSTRNWKSVFDAGTTGALSVIIGTAANNIFTITAAKLQLAEEPGESDRDGVMVDDLVFDCIATAGDDELSIVNS